MLGWDPSDYAGGLPLPPRTPSPLGWPWATVRWDEWGFTRRIVLAATLGGVVYQAPGDAPGQELEQAAARLWRMAAADQGLAW